MAAAVRTASTKKKIERGRFLEVGSDGFMEGVAAVRRVCAAARGCSRRKDTWAEMAAANPGNGASACDWATRARLLFAAWEISPCGGETGPAKLGGAVGA